MSYKKTGIILGVVLVLVALLVFIISKIEIEPKKEQPKQTQSSVVTTESSNEQEEKTTEDKKETTTASEVTTEPVVVDNESGLSLVKITAEDKLDYSGVQQTTTGVVKSKTCYLIGTQVTYALEIEATMGTESKIIQHFCTYSVYDEIEVGDMLSILYQQTTTNTFSVVSVSK